MPHPLHTPALPLSLTLALLFCIFTTPAQAVTCTNDNPPTNPNSAYYDHGDGTVTDIRTGLMWKRCSEGQTWDGNTCVGRTITRTFDDAQSHAATVTFAGHDDWRVPSISELQSLVEGCRSSPGPTINDTIFPGTPSSAFWSASPYADHWYYAWGVFFDYGDSYGKHRSGTYRVRLARGGQCLGPLGGLIVTIEPAAARESGAQWRRVGTPDWRSSWDLEIFLPEGEYEIEFRRVAGWIHPDNQVVSVIEGETTNLSVVYDRDHRIQSSTHPDYRETYFNSTFTVLWDAVDFPEMVNGWLWVADQSPGTIVDLYNGTFLAPDIHTLTFTDREHGTYWFHLVPLDARSDIIPEAQTRFMYNVNSNTPVVSSDTHPNQDVATSLANVRLGWSIDVVPESSIARYWYRWNRVPTDMPTKEDTAIETTSRIFLSQADGSHYFHVVAEDLAGNFSQVGRYRVNINEITGPPAGSNYFTVTFKDYDATVLKTEEVTRGGAATPPADPTRVGHTFTGWDTDFSNVTGNLVVTAQYQINIHTVTFRDHDGTTLKTEEVGHGSAATPPDDPARVGHTFTGWDTDFRNVTGDLTVTAVYEVRTFTLTVTGGTGSGTYQPGTVVTIQAGEPVAEQVFDQWTGDVEHVADVSSMSTTVTMPASDVAVTARYRDVVPTYTVTPSAGGNGGIAPDTPQTVNHGETATFTVTARPGYMAMMGGTCGGRLVGDTYTTAPITAHCTVVANFQVQENRAPFVEVAEQRIFLANMGGTAVLDASPSSDPDGDVLFFSWREHHENPHHGLIPLAGDSLSRLHVSFPGPGRYQFDVRVSDGVLMSEETQSITVYVPGIKGLIGFTPSDALVRVPDALVRVHATADDVDANVNPVDLAISDSLGRYILENVEPEDNQTGRTYFARVDRPGFQSSEIVSLTVRPDPGFEGNLTNRAIGRGHLATLSGFVRTPDGAPIENALVSITPGLGARVVASTTNSNGRFQMSDVPKGSWNVQLLADGYRPEVRDVNVAEGMPELQYTLQTAPGTGTLGGTVHLAGTDRPVANALVRLGTGADARSDSQGRYAFTDIPVGEYILTVSRDGYEPRRLPVVPVRTGSNALDLPISFATRGILVFGTITDAVSGNPVRLATVGVESTAGLLSHGGVADYTGFYQLRDVPAGEQRLRVSAPGYVTRIVTDTVTSGRAVDIALERAENWTAPVIPGQGLPVARVAEEFIFLNTMRQSALLDARPSGTNLRYVWRENPDNPVLGLLPAGAATRAEIQISGFSRPGMYIFELHVQRDGLLSANTATITVFAPGLAGNVHASPSDGIFGLNAATVRAYTDYDDARTWQNNFVDSTQTVDNPIGNFAFENLSPGAYWIVARAQTGTGYEQYGPVKRRVGSNTAARQSQINMPREEFSLGGTVTDATTGAPLENVRVIVAPGSLSESYRTTTDATGRFRLSAVPRGSGQPVMLMREGYRTRVSLVDISGDMTHDMSLTPEPEAQLASLSGRVTADYQGILLPVHNAEVIVGSGLYRTFSDADGFYEIANLPPGHYYGTIRKPGYIPQGLADMQFATLNPGPNTINKRLTFAANGPVIRGTVINAGQEPIPGVTIRVLEPSGGFAAWARTPEADEIRAELAREQRSRGLSRTATAPQTDPGGIFQMLDLPHGQRRIQASLPDGRIAVKTVNVDGNMQLVFSEADFLATHVLTYTAGTGGRIEGTTPQAVINGGNGTPVRAVPVPGYRFVRWSDGITTAQRQETGITQNLTLTAEFTPNPSVTVTPTVPDGGGRVEVTGGTSHPDGSLVVFRAIADTGMVFSHWMHNGERMDGAGAVHVFAVSEGMVLTAHFKAVKGLPGVLMLLLEG